MNEGTKLVPFIQEEPKEYEATLKLGEETETRTTGPERVISGTPLGRDRPRQS